VTNRNPATQLLLIFERWSRAIGEGYGGANARGWNGDAGAATAEHIQAWRHLSDLIRTIDGISDLGMNVSAAKSYYSVWGRMIASVDVSWSNGNGADQAFPQDALSQLQSVSTIIELAGSQVTPTNLELLNQVITQAIELLKDDESLSDELRSYLVKLIREIRNALEDDEVGGGFNFAEAAERLWVAMHAASSQSTSKSNAWKTAALKLLPPTASGVLTHVGTVGFDFVAKALGS
jgi:hypothetical protein